MRISIFVFILVLFKSIEVSAVELNSICDVVTLPSIEYQTCLYKAHDDAEKNLNYVYADRMEMFGLKGGELVETLKGTQWEVNDVNILKNSLQEGQKAWFDYRDKNCEYYSLIHYPGSASSIEYLKCKLSMTLGRIEELGKQRNIWREN